MSGCVGSEAVLLRQDQVPFRSDLITAKLDPSGTKVYVVTRISGDAGGFVSIINVGEFDTEVERNVLRLDFSSRFILFGGDGRFAYIYGISGAGSARLSKIDRQNHRVIGKVELGRGFSSVGGVLSLDGTRLFLGDRNANSVIEIDTRNMRRNRLIPISGGPAYGLALSLDGSTLFVAQPFSNAISVVDILKGDERVLIRKIGKLPIAISVNEKGTRLYVLDNGPNGIIEVDIEPEGYGNVLREIDVANPGGTPITVA